MRIALSVVAISLACIFSSHGKLLDRIVAVFNDQVITLSEIKQIQSNIKARSGIASGVYPSKKYTFQEIIDKEITIRTIRTHLNSSGYTISDDQVETMINRLQNKFSMNRKALRSELAKENISFPEYFELLRASREYSILLGVIIEPLVTITEQQIKNRFFQDNISNSTFSIGYSLTAYQISTNSVKKEDITAFAESLPTYMSKGIIPKKFSAVRKVELKDMKEDDLEPSSKNALKKTNEGSFSPPLQLGEFHTVFYVQKKNLVESGPYQKERPKIRQTLFLEETKKALAVWLAREQDKHYIKKF